MFYEKLAEAKESRSKKRKDRVLGAGALASSLALSSGALRGENSFRRLHDRHADEFRKLRPKRDLAHNIRLYTDAELKDGRGLGTNYDMLSDLPPDVLKRYKELNADPKVDSVSLFTDPVLKKHFDDVEGSTSSASQKINRNFRRAEAVKKYKNHMLLGSGVMGVYGLKKLYDSHNKTEGE
jgi:hypothetical protein